MATVIPAACAALSACTLRGLMVWLKLGSRVPSMSIATRRTGGCMVPVYRATPAPAVVGAVMGGTPGGAEDGAESPQMRCAMQPRVLVAYVTRSGSTEDVAESVGTTMKEAGISVDVKP